MQALTFFEELDTENIPNSFNQDSFVDLCLAAEEHLGNIISHFSFLVKYKLASIKDIELIKTRHESPRYRHHQIMLNRALTVANVGMTEIGVVYDNFMDNRSVLFFESKGAKVNHYLNMSPFIIDENAYNQSVNSKLYVYSHRTRNQYCYSFINNPRDNHLIITEDHLPSVKKSMWRCQKDLLNLKEIPPNQNQDFQESDKCPCRCQKNIPIHH